MAAAAKTYSFRAPGDLGDRLHRAQDDFRSIMRDRELAAHFGNEFDLALLRRLQQLGQGIADGVFTRAIAEAFVGAIERVRWEQEHMEEFAAFDREDVEGDAWRNGALKLFASGIPEDE
ncbi:MAG TPA: hypothetical protein VFF79_13545 [Conexibacter sp.]|jgi:hypothetical protein|nr:hypothetical protein [Conexibacter sp.]